MSVSTKAEADNIANLRSLKSEGTVVALRNGWLGIGVNILYSGSGQYSTNISSKDLPGKLTSDVVSVYCVNQKTLLFKDPDFAKRAQEVEWPHEIKVIEIVADNSTLISKTTDILNLNKSWFW